MSKASLFPMAAVLAFGLAPALRAEPPPAKPLTEAELLKTLDGLGKGDPITKAPLSAEPAASPRAGTTSKEPPPKAEPVLPRSGSSSSPKPDLMPKTGPRTDVTKTDATKPDPDKPKKVSNPMPGSTPGQTEITSEEGAFDQKLHQAIFTIKVFVRNPEFTLSCEKLTAYMKHDDDKAKPGAATDPKATPAPGARATPARGTPTVAATGVKVSGTPAPGKPDKTDKDTGGVAGGLDKAFAESFGDNRVEIIQDKLADDGTITHNVGHGKTALYESATGDITLRGKPEVQQGINTCVALDEGTIIILNKDGHMKTIGRTMNIIREATTATPAPKTKPAATPDGR